MSESVENDFIRTKMKKVRARESELERVKAISICKLLPNCKYIHTQLRVVYKMGCTSKNAAAATAALEATTSFSRTISTMTSNNAVIHVSLPLVLGKSCTAFYIIIIIICQLCLVRHSILLIMDVVSFFKHG